MDLERAPKDEMTPGEAFSRILSSVGDFGRWQWIFSFEVGLIGIFTALQSFAAVFLAATPDHWCKIPSLPDNGSFTKDVRYITTPLVLSNDRKSQQLSSCKHYDYDFSYLTEMDEFVELPSLLETRSCDSWHYDNHTYDTTLVSEWDLVCDRKWMASSIQAGYQLGVLVGAILITSLSDRWGRRMATLIGSVIFLISSIATAFSSSLVMFFIFRFISAASGQGVRIVTFVVLVEVTGTAGRVWVGSLFILFFTVGQCILPLLAYFIRDWRTLQLVMSVPIAFVLSYFCIYPESPRWLIQHGRTEEGLSVLTKIAKINGGSLPPPKELQRYLKVLEEDRQKGIQASSSEGCGRFCGCCSNVMTLFRTRNLRRRMLINLFAWLVINAIYFGLPFNGENIDVSLYVLVFAINSIGIPVVFIIIPILSRFGRRLPLAISTVLAGLFAFVVIFVPKELTWANLTLTILGRVMADFGYEIMYIYSAELFPTNVRCMAMGLSSMFGRVGSIMAPFIIDLLGDIYYAAPSTIFGIISVIAGMLIILLPETGFTELPDSVEEIESAPK